MFKFIIVGDSSTGKSKIFSRFTDDRFDSKHELTIGVEFGTKIIAWKNKKYKLQIWDTAGQETFRALTKTFYRGTIGCLLVYDITERDSFESIKYWIRDLKENCDPNIVIALVGNKIDLESEGKRVITTEDGQTFANENKLLFFETSAKTGANVNTCFCQVVDEILKKIEIGEINIVKNKESVLLVNPTKLNDSQTSGWKCC